jgi:hypothetical protein
MLRLKRSLIACVFALLMLHSNAQIDSAHHHLMLDPTFIAFNGIKITYELNITKNHWVELSPKFYFGSVEGMDGPGSGYEFKEVNGYGLNLEHKIYAYPKKYYKPCTYVSYGIIADYYTIKYIDTEDALKPLVENSFPKLGGDLIIGFDVILPHFPLVFGPYAGIGYRFAFTDDAGMKAHFTKNYYDYAYSGNLFVFGFKLGARF